MLTDAALKHLKPKDKMYKVTDRDGMYVAVTPNGSLVFRYDYRLNGWRETLTLGRYGDVGISLARAREKCLDARRAVAEGRSPAQEKQREKRRLKEARSFGQFGERWFEEGPMAESTRAMRRVIFDRDIVPAWKNRLLTEVTPDDLRALCLKVKNRGAPATAIHVRDIVEQIYGFAILHGERIKNPADDVAPASIARRFATSAWVSRWRSRKARSSVRSTIWRGERRVSRIGRGQGRKRRPHRIIPIPDYPILG